MTGKELIGAAHKTIPLARHKEAQIKHYTIHPYASVWNYQEGGAAVINNYYEPSYGGGGMVALPRPGLLYWKLPPILPGVWKISVGYYQYNGGGSLTFMMCGVTRTVGISTHNTVASFMWNQANTSSAISAAAALMPDLNIYNNIDGGTCYIGMVQLDWVSA